MVLHGSIDKQPAVFHVAVRALDILCSCYYPSNDEELHHEHHSIP